MKKKISASHHVKAPCFLSELRLNCIYLTCTRNIQISRVMKFRRVGAELFHAYKRTDRYDGSNGHFSQFDAPNNEPLCVHF